MLLSPCRKGRKKYGGIPKMKKVVFSITNVRSKSDKKLSGFGYLAEGNLLCPCISKNSKPYIRIFNDVEKRCRPVNGKSRCNHSHIDRLMHPFARRLCAQSLLQGIRLSRAQGFSPTRSRSNRHLRQKKRDSTLF